MRMLAADTAEAETFTRMPNMQARVRVFFVVVFSLACVAGVRAFAQPSSPGTAFEHSDLAADASTRTIRGVGDALAAAADISAVLNTHVTTYHAPKTASSSWLSLDVLFGMIWLWLYGISGMKAFRTAHIEGSGEEIGRL